jgi:hypothetical protein
MGNVMKKQFQPNGRGKAEVHQGLRVANTKTEQTARKAEKLAGGEVLPPFIIHQETRTIITRPRPTFMYFCCRHFAMFILADAYAVARSFVLSVVTQIGLLCIIFLH